MPATMRDVAALAGVSLKTVSRVVNLQPHTRPEVVQRVRAAIAELDWVPNASARALRTGRTGVVGVAVPALRPPYAAILVEAVVSETTRRGLQAAVEPTLDDHARTRSLLGSVGTAVDGVILIGPYSDEVFDGLQPSDPVVTLYAGGGRPVDSVDPDLVEAASLLARHLVVMGRSRPVLVGFDRFAGGEDVMVAALTGAGVRPAVPSIRGARDRADGVTAAGRLLSGPPVDAIVCGSDEVAMGVLSALASAGTRIPDDVVVTGMDNIEDGVFATPSLTTIDPLPRRLARAVIDLLADRLGSNAPAEARHVLAPVELVRRESTLGMGLA
ncbi:LacI family DNA-binding transcriptional regulator [Antribacter gilvus]|uniref:LacI family DNA-binding transcriptional regulator n=1 Tax=Antribacter gilvus TaxID=2304675 RepID=UPI001F0C9374|nr:LacI family DNA-binding transcriptional regulator [Antribacter gilvus]